MATTSDDRLRYVGSVLWSLLPGVTLGFATPFVMFHVAIKKRSILQGLSALVYAAMFVAVMVISDSEDPFFSVAMVINLIVGTIHAFLIREWVFNLGRFKAQQTMIDQQKEALAAHAEAADARAAARKIVGENPKLATQLRIGRVDIAHREFPDGGLIDVNNVPPMAMAEAAELPLELAQQITRERRLHGGYVSSADISVRLDLHPEILEHVDDRFVFLPVTRARAARELLTRRRAAAPNQ